MQGIERDVSSKLSSFNTNWKRILSEQCVYQIQSQKDSFLCELCEGKQAEGILFQGH